MDSRTLIHFLGLPLKLLQHDGKLDLTDREGESPSLQSAHVQHSGNEVEEFPRAVMDAAQRVDLFFVEATESLLNEQIGVSQDDIEGRAQLVGHSSQKLRLGPVSYLCGCFRPL